MGIGSTESNAAPVDIISLDMNMVSLELALGNQIHSFSTADPVSIVMGTYQNPIVTMADGDGDTVTIYTTPPNPAPSGTADAMLGTLNVDFTSMLADFVLAGGGGGGGGGGGSSFTVSLWDDSTTVDTNVYSGLDNGFMLGWNTDVVLSGGRGRLRMCAGGRMGRGTVCDTTTTLEGTANVVPLPAAAWLFVSGLAGFAGVSFRRYHLHC